MRNDSVVMAALFVIGGLLAAVVLASVTGVIDRVPGGIGALGIVLWGGLLCIVALVLFNPWWADPLGLMTPEELLRRLEDEGLLVSSDFQARRAFGVEEADDEGLHYFLELVDGQVLYLSSQYLYDYEPISDDPELNQPRRFPCTDFTIRRHKTEGHVVELLCKGTVIEPEFIASPFTRRERSIGILEDGQVLSDRPYDVLKELLSTRT